MKILKTPLHLTQVEKLVGFSFLIVIVVLNLVIVSSVQQRQPENTQTEAAGVLVNQTFGTAGDFAQTTDPCGFANLDFQNNQNNNAAPTGGTGAGGNGAGGNGAGGNGAGGNGAGGNGAGGNGAGGNGTGGNGAGGNGTGGNGAGGNGTGGNGAGGNGTGGNGTGGNGTGGNGTGGNGTGGNGTGGNGTGGNGTGGNGTGGNGTGGNGTGGNGTGGNGTGGNGTGGNGTGGNGTGGNGTGGNGTGGNGTGGNGTGGNGTGGNGAGGNGAGGNGAGGNGAGGNGAGGNGAGGNGAGGNGAGGNGAGGNGTGGNGTGGNGTGVAIANANVETCTDAIGTMNSNDILNYVLGDSNAGKNTRSANVNSNTMETGARFATTTEPLFLGALTAIYADEFQAYADGLNYGMNPKTETVEQIANNDSYATTTVNDPEADVFDEVASCYKVGCWSGKNGENGNYNDANMKKLIASFGFTAIANENGVGAEDVNTYGAFTQALEEATPTVQLEMLNDVYTANAGNGTTTNDIVENLNKYKQSLAFVLSDSLATEEQDYETGVEIKKAPTYNVQIAQQGYNFNCVGSTACPTVVPGAATGNTVGAIGNNNGAGGNGAGGNGTGGNGAGGNGTGGNGAGGNGTGGNGAGGNGTGGNGAGGNGTGGNGAGGNGTGGNGAGNGGGSSLSDLISQLMNMIQQLFGNL